MKDAARLHREERLHQLQPPRAGVDGARLAAHAAGSQNWLSAESGGELHPAAYYLSVHTINLSLPEPRGHHLQICVDAPGGLPHSHCLPAFAAEASTLSTRGSLDCDIPF